MGRSFLLPIVGNPMISYFYRPPHDLPTFFDKLNQLNSKALNLHALPDSEPKLIYFRTISHLFDLSVAFCNEIAFNSPHG